MLKPKAMISYISEDTTVRQAVEKMRRHGYTAVPVINRRGEFVKALAEGDFLWFILQNGIRDMAELSRYSVADIPKRVVCEPVSVSSTMDDLFRLSMQQNFVPVTDDRGMFIGIVTRRDILQACYDIIKSNGMLVSQPEYELESRVSEEQDSLYSGL